jgi:uncharacterized protein YgiM (DUF1202 family)
VNSKKIGEANAGDSFEVISSNSQWYEIKLAEGLTGFISAQFIEAKETKTEN